MTVVSRHPPRRYHAPNRGRTFPNPPKARNKQRKANGRRAVHVHSNAGIIDLKTFPDDDIARNARAVYGWLSTKISKTMSVLARNGSTEGSPELTTWQQAKHHLAYILVDLLNIDNALPHGEQVKRLNKRVFPTFENVYSAAQDFVEGRDVVIAMLEKLCQHDDRFVVVRKLM